MEAQQAVASHAKMSKPLGLSEPKGEEEDTPLVCRAIAARKSVYGNCSEGLAEALRKTAKGRSYLKELAEKDVKEQAVAKEKKAVLVVGLFM